MKKSVQIDYLSDMDKIFDGSRIQHVTYVAPIDMEVEIGDIVLVERYNGAMTIGQVRSIHEYDRERPNASKVFNVLAVMTDSCSVFRQKYNDVARARIESDISEHVRKTDQKQVYEAYQKWAQS